MGIAGEQMVTSTNWGVRGALPQSLAHTISANLPELRICNPALRRAGYGIPAMTSNLGLLRAYPRATARPFGKPTPCPPPPLVPLGGFTRYFRRIR